MVPYPPPVPIYRPAKSYLGEAFITLILYYLGFGVIGLIANLLFLSNARRDERLGLITQNVGCLQVLLWVHILLIAIGCIFAIVFLALGGLGALAAIFGSPSNY
jgi:thiosulfate reductase cytochrome b subunit